MGLFGKSKEEKISDEVYRACLDFDKTIKNGIRTAIETDLNFSDIISLFDNFEETCKKNYYELQDFYDTDVDVSRAKKNYCKLKTMAF